jgi:hypothetical protein
MDAPDWVRHKIKVNLRKLNELEVWKQYQIKISNRFAALGIFIDSKDINRTWEIIKENIKISAKRVSVYELKHHKSWFIEECLHCLNQRKHAKMQWLQGPSHSNVDNLNNVRHEASRHFRNKNKEFLIAKLMNLKVIVN